MVKKKIKEEKFEQIPILLVYREGDNMMVRSFEEGYNILELYGFLKGIMLSLEDEIYLDFYDYKKDN